MNRDLLAILVLKLMLTGCWAPACSAAEAEQTQAGLIDIKTVIPDVVIDLRYAGFHNFIGEPVIGYSVAKCLLTPQAAQQLASVQQDLKAFSLALKIYDCYRPQRAVDHFLRWAAVTDDTRMQQEFYPRRDKHNLFADGYIAAKSSHSRGSTVDITLVPLPVPQQALYLPGQPLQACDLEQSQRFQDNSLDMGTGFDCFDALANTENPRIGLEQRINRLLLKTLMEQHGFKNYALEWWHFTLVNEPFPDRYFDIAIE